MSNHELHIEPRISDAFLLEERSTFLKNIEDGRHVERV
jgi:hypothetical protein